MSNLNLNKIFDPSGVAVIGASEKSGSVGGTVLRNLQKAGYGSRLRALNPKHEEVFGVPCRAAVSQLEAAPDLTVICTPAKTVPDLVDQCGSAAHDSPESAIQAFMHLTSFTRNLETLHETPHEISIEFELNREDRQERARGIMQRDSETLLETEAKRLLSLYQIPVAETKQAVSADEAVQAARAIGYPVVVKIASREITHKTDGGGVALNLQGDDDVTRAYDEELVGVGRLVADPDHNTAGYAVLVADDWQGQRLGTILTDYCVEVGAKWGLQRIIGESPVSNERMLSVFRDCGFELSTENGHAKAEKLLQS
jgi:acyl-CoA synthetase (NDP forming)